MGGTNYYTETLLYNLTKAGTKLDDVDEEEGYSSNEEAGKDDK